MTSTETRIKLRTLSTSTTDPNKAGELMLEAANEAVRMTKRIVAYNLVKGLRKRRVGTHAIEKAARILIESDERDEAVVVQLLDIAIKASEKKLKLARKVAFSSSKRAKAILPAGWVRRRFREILKQEVEPLHNVQFG